LDARAIPDNPPTYPHPLPHCIVGFATLTTGSRNRTIQANRNHVVKIEDTRLSVRITGDAGYLARWTEPVREWAMLGVEKLNLHGEVGCR